MATGTGKDPLGILTKPAPQSDPLGLLSQKKSPDFSHGYTPTATDIATKKSFDDLESGFDKSPGGSGTSPLSPQVNDFLQHYWQQLSPNERETLNKLSHRPSTDGLRAATKDEIKQQHAMDTTWGKVKKSVAYIGSQTAKGGLDVVKGGAWLLNHMNSSFTDTQIVPDKVFKSADKLTDFGITPGQKSDIENSKNLGFGAVRTLGMLGNIAPAAIGGEAAELPKTAFALQGLGQGKTTMDEVDPDHKLNPVVRDLYIAGSGAANTLLADMGENYLSKPVQESVVNGIVSHALQDATEKGLTEDGFKTAIQKSTKGFTTKFNDILNTYAEKTGRAAIDISALQAAQFALKKGVDIASDKPVFNENLGNLMSNISDIVTKQAPIFGGIGAMLDGAKADPIEKQKAALEDQIRELNDQIKPTDDPIETLHNEAKKAQLKELNKQYLDLLKKQNDKSAQTEQTAKDVVPKVQEKVPSQASDEEPANNQVTNIKTPQDENNENAQERGQKEADAQKAESRQEIDKEGNVLAKAGGEKPPVYKETPPEEVTSPELKGKDYKSEMMSPQDYLKQSDEVAGGKTIDPKMVDEVKAAMRKGEPLEPATLTYDKEGKMTAQDGRHRAQAAIDLGIKEIPVVKIEGELPNATKEISKQKGGVGEHPSGDEGRKASETSSSNRIISTKESEGEKIPEGLSHKDAHRWYIEHEKDPNELAAMYHTEQAYANDKERAIIDYLGNSKINERDYNRWGDRNRLDAAKKRRWIDTQNSDRTGLDIHAEALSHELGYEVTPEDFIDVIDKYKGREHFNEENKSDEQRLLEQRYEELTGKKLTPKRAEAAFNNKLNLTPAEHTEANELLKEHGLTTKDIEDEQQERNTGSEEATAAIPDEKGVQQPQDDGAGNASKATTGKGTQGEEAKKSGLSIKKPQAGDPLREFANKVRDGKISKLGGFRSSSLFDKAWDGSLEAVATAIDGGAKLVDAIEAGLSHIRSTEWYKSLTDKKGFEEQYKAHLTKEYEGGGELTGIRHADTEKERAETGTKSDITKKDRSREAIDAKGKELVDNDEYYAQNIAKDIIEKERPATDVEQAALEYRKTQLKNQRRKLLKDTDPDNLADNEIKLAAINDEIALNQKATDIGGSELGSGLGYRTQVMREDYSTETVLNRAEIANGKNPLTPKDKAQLIASTKRIEELEGQLSDREDEIRKLQEKNTVSKVNRAATIEERNAKREITKASLRKEREGLIADLHLIAKKARSSAGANKIPVDMVVPLTKLARNYVLDGAITIAQVTDKIYNDLKDHIEGVTKDEISDVIKDGFDKYLTEQNEIRVERAKKLAQKTIDELQKRIDNKEYLKPDALKLTPDEKLKELRNKIKDLKAIINRFGDEERGLSENAKRLIKAKKLQQTKLENLKSDTYEKKVYKKILVDNDYLNIRAQINREQARINKKIADIENSQKSWNRKIVDFAVKYGRQAKLASVTVLGKLSATGLATVGLKPVTEGIGKVLSEIPGLRRVAKRSSVEGSVAKKSLIKANELTEGAAVKSLSQAYSRAATIGMKDAWQEVAQGGSNLSALYKERGATLPAEAKEFFGHIHSAIKAPIKRFAWEHSYAKRVAKTISKGLDPLDPVIDAQNRLNAYKDGEKAIFMGDNHLSKVYENAVGSMERSNSSSARTAAAAMRVLIPFVKVPSNIVLEGAKYSFGSASGIARLGRAFANGMENLSPEEADVILEHLKKGAVGGAAMAYGFFHPEQFGGFYQQGKKEKVAPGHIKIGGVDIPAFLVEHPIFIAAQLGANFRQLMDKYRHKDDRIPVAAMATLSGLGYEVPQANEIKRLIDLTGNVKSMKGITKFGAETLKGEIEPAFLQQLAKITDTKDGSVVSFSSQNQQKRVPDYKKGKMKYIGQTLETGVPWVRQNVPKDKQEEPGLKQLPKD